MRYECECDGPYNVRNLRVAVIVKPSCVIVVICYDQDKG